MGYSTYYSGQLTLTPAFTDDLDFEMSEESDWYISNDGNTLRHNGNEKSYYQRDELEKIAQKFQRLNIELNGKLIWSGEDADDSGVIIVKNNEVRYKTIEGLLELVSWDQLK